MNSKYKSVYILLLSLYVFFWLFFGLYFLIGMTGGGTESIRDAFFIPGAEGIEWFLAINIFFMIGIIGIAFLAYAFSSLFLKGYIKGLGKKHKVGLIPFEEISAGQMLRKILIRAIILGFFIANIAYTLASQEFVINFVRITPAPDGAQLIPDPEVMYHLLWITAIPCMLLLIPIWLMINGGLISTKKLKGADFETVNLAASPLYKIVKGYAGIGFIYNYMNMIMFWAVPRLISGSEGDIMGPILQLVSPFIIVFGVVPVVILIEMRQQKYREKIEKILVKLDLNQDFINNIELKKR